MEKQPGKKISDSEGLILSRKQIRIFFFMCFLLPVLVFLLLHGFRDKGAAAFILFSGGIGFCGVYFLLNHWEEKMRLSVGELVKIKMNQAQGLTSSDTSKDLLEEIRMLNEQFEEARKGYEHQVDLLQTSAAKSRERVEELNMELNKKVNESHATYLAYEDLKREFCRLEEECMKCQKEAKEKLQHKETLIADYQQTVGEQRKIIEKKQRYILKLEGKVRDLMYEIRSLLQLEDGGPSPLKFNESAKRHEEMPNYCLPPLRAVSSYDLSQQLQRYVESAEKFTGVDHLGYREGKSLRFYDMLDSCAIDQRRYFDTLREETVGIVFVFSLLEHKFLFVNNFVKTILGWSPEKFMKDFPHLVVSGLSEWRESLFQLGTVKQQQNKIAVQSKFGEPIRFDCFMGIILHGPFTNQVLGILSQKEKR